MISQIFSRIKQAMIAHWRGEMPVIMTIVVTAIGLRLLLGMIPSGENLAIIVILITASLLIAIWQVVGLSRCADRYLKSTGDLMMYWGAYIAMLLVSVITVVQVLDLSAGPAPIVSAESLRTQPLPSISDDGKTIFLTGDINYALDADLTQILKQNPSIRTVELSSAGGLIYAARSMAITIERYGLNTHVEDDCNSACTLAFIAGKSRTLGSLGKIGFHQYEFKKLHPLQLEQVLTEQEKDRQYLEKRGVSDAFIEQAYQSSHDEIWWPDRDTLYQAAVINVD